MGALAHAISNAIARRPAIAFAGIVEGALLALSRPVVFAVGPRSYIDPTINEQTAVRIQVDADG